MNTKTIRYLAAAVIALAAILIATEVTDNGDSQTAGGRLFPDLRPSINDITSLSVSGPDESDVVTLTRAENGWLVGERDGYPADIGKIRQVLLAIADAKTVEQKTSNPERYAELGVSDEGRVLRISGDGFVHEIIIGNRAQSKYRYARVVSEEQSWLIDADPEMPDDIGGWLQPEIIDIDAAQVRGVTIEHADGETIRISKESEEDTDFTVNAIPDGRELSYATVANGIGGALNDLRLQDVRGGDLAAPSVITTFETFDGTTITVEYEQTDDGTWLAMHADGTDAEVINDAASGWLFKVADYKANLLARRWEDILKAEEE